MSKAISVPYLGFPKAERGPEAWLGCLLGSWLQAGLPTGHLASSTCVLIRILITTVREMLPSKQSYSLGGCVWCLGRRRERGGGLGFSSADAERRSLQGGLGQSGLQLPRLSPPHVLPWIPWDSRKKWPHVGASLCRRHCRQSFRGSRWHTEQEKQDDVHTSHSQGLQSHSSRPLLWASSLGREPRP